MNLLRNLYFQRLLVKLAVLLSACFIIVNCSGGGGSPGEEITEETPQPSPPPIVEDEDQLKTEIIIASGDVNHRGISSYQTNGVFSEQIINLRAFESSPNGLVAGPGNNSFITSTNGADSLLEIPYADDFDFFYGSTLLNGNVYDIEFNPVLNFYYVVESTNIEVFDTEGARISAALIPRTVGACTLSGPRNIHITSDGIMYVADLSASRIHKYDITSITATCLESYSMPGTSPYGVIKHSNNLLYISSFGDDAVYTFDEDTDTLTNIFDPGLTILRDPTGLAELPNGDIIVASSVTDSIEKISADGIRDGFTPFISDIYSLNITDIEVITH